MNARERGNTLRRLANAVEARPNLPSRPLELLVEGVVHGAVGLLELLARVEPQRECAWCGKPLVRKQFNSRAEPLQQFLGRRFCDRACAGKAREAQHARERSRPEGELARAAREAGAKRRSAQREHAKERPRREPRPTPVPRPQPTPVRDPVPARPDPKSAPVTAEAPRVRLPDPRPRRDGAVAQPVTLGEPCPEHPSYTVGVYGCQACNAGRRWSESQRQVTARPRAASAAARIE